MSAKRSAVRRTTICHQTTTNRADTDCEPARVVVFQSRVAVRHRRLDRCRCWGTDRAASPRSVDSAYPFEHYPLWPTSSRAKCLRTPPTPCISASLACLAPFTSQPVGQHPTDRSVTRRSYTTYPPDTTFPLRPASFPRSVSHSSRGVPARSFGRPSWCRFKGDSDSSARIIRIPTGRTKSDPRPPTRNRTAASISAFPPVRRASLKHRRSDRGDLKRPPPGAVKSTASKACATGE